MYTDAIERLLTGLLTHLQLPFTNIAITEVEDLTRVEISSDVPSKLIGHHGDTLNSIQHVLKSMIRTEQNLDRAPFVVCDVDGYRADQEKKVCDIAERKIALIRKTGTRIALPAMSPYFRRIVHLYIAANESLADITTESTGKGDHRQIVLKLKDESAFKAAKQDADSGELQPVIEDDDTGSDDLDNLDI
jgi:predicted RNA-binding protein Jag